MNAKLSGIKKHFPKLVMTVAMLLSILPASAYDFEANGIYFNITDATKHEVEVTEPGSEREYSGNINIPSTVMNEGTTYTVTSIGEFAFSYYANLTSVTIPNSVTSIGFCAFRSCRGLTSVNIPNSVMSIGSNAFAYCTGLTSVTIPNSVTSISSNAFFGCTGLTNVTIPNSVTYIGFNAFFGCTGLTSVNIPNSVMSIADWAFGDCTGLTSVTIGNSMTSYIGFHVFNGCTGLIEINVDSANKSYASIEGVLFNKNLTAIVRYPAGKPETTFSIPNSVTSIRDCAFESCTGLTSVTIPNSVTSIGDSAFDNCSGLIEINVDPSNSFYASVDGVLYNKNLTEIIRYPAGKPETTFSIPSSVTSIGYAAFQGCTGLTSVTIPNSVTSIGDYAFQGCGGLKSVAIPNSVTSIGDNAFEDCRGLTSVTIGSSVTSIGGWAFDGCTGLTSVTIPNSVTSIETAAFQRCTGLTSVTIPSSVTSIEDWAFWKCPLKSVYCHWAEPISFNVDNLFIDYSYNEGTLYVPKGCAGKYRSTSPWSKFLNIEEADYLGVEDIIANQQIGDYIVYDLKGVLVIKTADMDEVKQLPAGLYIVNGKKVLIR